MTKLLNIWCLSIMSVNPDTVILPYGQASLRLPQNCSFTLVNCAILGFVSLVIEHMIQTLDFIDEHYLSRILTGTRMIIKGSFTPNCRIKQKTR